MNYNFDLMTLIDYFTGAFICCFGSLIMCKILLIKSFKEINKWKLFLLIPISIFTIFNTLAFDNIFKVFGSLLVLLLINKFILNVDNIKLFIYSITSYIMLILSELVFAFLISLIDFIFHYSIALDVTKAIYSNLIIAFISWILVFIARKKINNIIRKIDKSNMLILSIQVLLSVFVILSLFNFLYFENWKLSYKFILIMVIMIGSLLLVTNLLKQFFKNKEVVSKYSDMQEYLKTSANLIEKYSSTVHKYKNNLIVIKGYIKSDIPEANNYIDSLLDKMKDKQYSWVKKINNIFIDSIRYIIYYKLSKAEEMNLNIFVNVSKDVKAIDSKYLTSDELSYILDILGEYFDNAIYASFESKEKQLNFDLYKKDNQLIFSISNTYKGDVDLSLITKNGYTTKGKGHGFGLYDIEKVIKNIKILSNKYEILDNYFVTYLMIDLNNIK